MPRTLSLALVLACALPAAAGDYVERSYPIGAFLKAKDAEGFPLMEADSVEELVTVWVGEDTWDPPAKIEIKGAKLVVKQTKALQAETKTALKELARALLAKKFRSLEAWRKVDAKAAKKAKRKRSKADKAVYKGLENQVSLNFNDTSLGDVLEFLRMITKLEIKLQPQAKKGLDSCDGVTLQLKDTPLREAIDKALAAADPELRWRVHEGGLQIGMIEEQPPHMFSRIYDARAFLSRDKPFDPEVFVEGMDRTMDLYEESAITYFNGALLVHASAKGHQQVMALVEEILRDPEGVHKRLKAQQEAEEKKRKAKKK